MGRAEGRGVEVRMGFVEGLWDAVRPAKARWPWRGSAAALAPQADARRGREAGQARVFSTLIKEVLEEQYLTAYDYDQWVEYDTLSDADRAGIAAHVARMPTTPTLSVIMPAYNSDEQFLREAIASVRGQLYPHWELCVADDASTVPHVYRLCCRRPPPRIAGSRSCGGRRTATSARPATRPWRWRPEISWP